MQMLKKLGLNDSQRAVGENGSPEEQRKRLNTARALEGRRGAPSNLQCHQEQESTCSAVFIST